MLPIDEESTPVSSGRIAVVLHPQSWPAAFELVRETNGYTLGTIKFDARHNGSTAVPGLCAKPTIDVDIVLHASNDITQAIGLLKETDRVYHGDPNQDGMRTFTSHRVLSPGHRLYVCASGTPTHLKRVVFRSYLRAHPEVAAAYGDLKRELVMESGGDWKAYTNGKNALVAKVPKQASSTIPE